MQPQKLEDRAARNFHLLYSAQTGRNVPARFDADDNGNLKRVGRLKNFFICILNRFTGAKTIDAMNDRVKNAIQKTFTALKEHIDRVEQIANSNNFGDLESKVIFLGSLSVRPKGIGKFKPEEIDKLDDLSNLWRKDLLRDDEFFTSFTQHRPQHNPLPDNLDNQQYALRTKVIKLKLMLNPNAF